MIEMIQSDFTDLRCSRFCILMIMDYLVGLIEIQDGRVGTAILLLNDDFVTSRIVNCVSALIRAQPIILIRWPRPDHSHVFFRLFLCGNRNRS